MIAMMTLAELQGNPDSKIVVVPNNVLITQHQDSFQDYRTEQMEKGGLNIPE